MLRTLNILSTLITDDVREMTLEQMAEQYRGSLNPSLLASAFSKTHKLIINVSNSYYGLTDEDVASFSLEKLDQCLQTFDPEKAGFVTYFTKSLMNKFREETEALNTHKRKAIFYSDSYDVMVQNGFDIKSTDESADYIKSTLNEYDLSEKEEDYCGLILQDMTNKDIAERMGVSVMTLTNLRKKLREKLSPLALRY